MYVKAFDDWSAKKQVLDKRAHKQDPFFHEREVWWASLGVNVGVESDGKHKNFERPVLIIRKLNNYMFWGVPLTSNKKDADYFVAIHHAKGVSSAHISQLRVLSSKRLLRKVGMIPQEEFREVVTRIIQKIQIDPR